MKKNILIFSVLLIFILINSCSSTSQTSTDRNIKFSVQAGANMGGIVENTDMSVVPNVLVPPEATVNAFTGATRTGVNIGVRFNQPLRRNEIETGIDFMFNSQEFNYIDAGNHFIGVRQLNVSQFMIPLTYNFVLSRKADIQLKIGYLAQFNLVGTEGVGMLPDYTIKKLSSGPTLGISALPFVFRNGSKLGFYVDIYRGSQIYEDYYNQSTFEMPGSSFVKVGFKYQLK